MPSPDEDRTRAMPRGFLALVAATLAAATFAVSPASAETTWPTHPIRLIVPFPAGSSSDIVGRLVAQKLVERLGQQIVVENRPGASGNLGTEAVAHAAADGYTLGLANTGTHTLSPSLMARPAYDPVKDFAPISMIGASPFVLAAYPGLPARDVPELIALAREKPGKLTFAEAGPATLANLAGVLFARMANIQLTPVSYKGTGQEVLDVIEGRVDMQFATIPPTLALIRERKLRAIAVTGGQRSPALPDVPAIAEAGFPGYEAVLWQAIYAPAGTPAAIVTRLNADLNAILRDPATVEALARLGVEAQPGSPEDLAARISADIKKWRDVIASAGIQPQ
jgi:tripartite-type tricarboxylate transporter receptor subunit TctC